MSCTVSKKTAGKRTGAILDSQRNDYQKFVSVLRSKENMRKALVSSSTHVTASSGNVFEDLGFPPDKAMALLFKAKILTRILEEVRRKKYRQGKLVELLDEHQPV